ncbi:glycosyltransferase family 2 protein [Candidatus Roizmanbacteria bacterium]|nr:glycosyltransferase family 2 protein [Candidatus Roizmanbacteria bacterium]
MKKAVLVSVIVPTFNCEDIIIDCLESVKKQSYRNIEIIIVDGFSTDKTPQLAKRFGKVYFFGKDPKQKNIFAVPYQRNYGVLKSKGEYIYYIDSDMRLDLKTIETCLLLTERKKTDAVIVPETSYGEGFWAKCRWLEKECYNQSPLSFTDAARFIRKSVWQKLGGLDVALGGGDDWDFQLRLNFSGYTTVKSQFAIRHYEGRLTLSKQLKKKYIYGKNVLDYLKKHRRQKLLLLKQYSLIRLDFLQNGKLLLQHPLIAIGMIFMKTLEYSAAILGMLNAQMHKVKIRVNTL